MSKTEGTLYIVATPIGNLGEITYLAVETLKSVSYIACEDTRRSSVLLNHYEIKKPLVSYREHNEREVAVKIVDDILGGSNLALVTDAGMPLISDPGSIVVNLAREKGVKVTVISGASAFVNAIVLSGFDTRSFTFLGFLPAKVSDRIEFIAKVKALTMSLVFYIPPHDLSKDMQFLFEQLGDRECCVVREISKLFEEVYHTTLGKGYSKKAMGEIVLVVDGCKDSNKLLDLTIKQHIEHYLKQGIEKNDAFKAVAKDRGISKSIVYKTYLD